MSDDLLELLGLPSDDVLATAWLSDDGVYRWTLSRTWGNPNRRLVFVMLNPSVADATKDDPTILRCIGYARRLGYDGIHVVNLYPYRATDPDDLAAAGYPTGGRRGDEILCAALENAWRHEVPVIAAWGAKAQSERVEWLLAQVGTSGLLHALGVTNSGAPKHPLARGRSRIPDDARPTPWPVVA